MLSMEGVMIEAARRADEEKRFVTLFRDPYQLLGVRDLPDPDEPLSDEERELFGIIDGHHTVADVVEAAPLSEYEAYEALQRMLESQWIEFVGRQEPGKRGSRANEAPRPEAKRNAGAARAGHHGDGRARCSAACASPARSSTLTDRPAPQNDVYAAAQVRDLRYALDLYARENGHYPARLDDLVEDHWVGADQVSLAGYIVLYRRESSGRDYRLDLKPRPLSSPARVIARRVEANRPAAHPGRKRGPGRRARGRPQAPRRAILASSSRP